MGATLLLALGLLLQHMVVLSRTAKHAYHGTPDSVLAGFLQGVHVLVSCVFCCSLASRTDVVDHGAGNAMA